MSVKYKDTNNKGEIKIANNLTMTNPENSTFYINSDMYDLCIANSDGSPAQQVIIKNMPPHTEDSYEITFDANGGSGSMVNQRRYYRRLYA